MRTKRKSWRWASVLLFAAAVWLLLLPAGPALAQVYDYGIASRGQGGVVPGGPPNGGFETGDLTGWRTDYNWSGGQGSPPDHVWEVKVAPEYAHSGKFGCRVYNADNYWWSGAWLISNDFTDTSAGYSMWLKLAGGCTTYWSGVIVDIADVDKNGNVIGHVWYEGNETGNAWPHPGAGGVDKFFVIKKEWGWKEYKFDFAADYKAKYGREPGPLRRIVVNAYQDTDYCDVYVDDIKGYGLIYGPPYANCEHRGETIGAVTVDTRHSCNKDSGAIAAFVGAWIGGGAAEAKQYLFIDVPTRARVYVDATINHVGGTVTSGLASFAGTQKVWEVDGAYNREDIDPGFGYDDIANNIIDLALLAGGGVSSVADAVEVIGNIKSAAELGNALVQLEQAGKAKEFHIQFSFDASPGRHTIGVGFRTNASAVVTGSAFAVMAGQVSSVVVNIVPLEEQSLAIFRIGQSQYEADGHTYPMDVAPYVKNGRSYVSIRYLANALGVRDQDITWNPKTKTAILKKGDITLYFTVGSRAMKRQVDLITPVTVQMDVVPEIRDGRICLPGRYVAEGFGYRVEWDEREKAVSVVALLL
ncbi:MAG: copper amine oxidase N-terminal domain-containing protein [Bacillota bacterium]